MIVKNFDRAEKSALFSPRYDAGGFTDFFLVFVIEKGDFLLTPPSMEKPLTTVDQS